ncbi:PucR family transcriptional regulator [Streptomyces sp. RFCAC02]|uniref:PucR family transcriptional regulator n=1 Tax=Streptomyces sp. RFCAC02 TaxID=2499143 RepID=UPI0010222EB2|nr:PucR family transcriptional regulator [Streptomyces sp. RFCAC02]
MADTELFLRASDTAPDGTLERMLSVVGTGALEVCAAPEGLGARVLGVTVWDALEPDPAPGQVVLAVGVDPGSFAAVDLLRTAGRCGAAAVVFRQGTGGPPGPALRATAREAGVAVLLRTAWAGWAQLVGSLRAWLAAGGVPADPEIERVALGDLDGLAEAVAALVGGAVTIEDVHSRVLAYSTTGADVDEIRMLTILGRRVPEWRVAALREAGFFSALWGSGDVVHRPAEGAVPERLAVAVSSAGEILGSIWVAAAGGPLPPGAAATLRAAARAAAPHLLHHRSRRAGEARAVQEAARALLDGHVPAGDPVARMGLRADRPCAVLAVGADTGADPDPAAEPGTAAEPDAGTAPDGAGDGGRLHDLLALHCAAYGQRAFVIPTGRDALVLIADLAPDAERAAAQAAQRGSFLAQQLSGVTGRRVRVGVGEVAARPDRAPESRRDAELALRALRFSRSATIGERATARVGDLAETVALLSVADTLRATDLPSDTPVARLVAYDARHRGGLLPTLRAYLDHFGDLPAAARALGVHPNTFRYRVQRLHDTCGIDLSDPDSRLLAHIQIRLLGPTE